MAEDGHELALGDAHRADAQFVERAAIGFDILCVQVFGEEVLDAVAAVSEPGDEVHLLTARSAEDFFFEVAEAGFGPRLAQLHFDGVHLLVHAGDVAFEFDPKFGNVVFRRHVLHDVREHVADLFERDLLGHEGIVRHEGNPANGRGASERGEVGF